MGIGADMLPVDVLVKIFSYCSFNDLVKSFQFVCNWWQQVSQEKRLWKAVVYEPCKTSSKEIIEILKISPQLQALDLMDALVDSKIIDELTHGCPQLQRLLINWDHILYSDTAVKLTKIKSLTLGYEENPYIDLIRLDDIFPNVEHLQFDALHCTKNYLVTYLEKKKNLLHTLRLRCCTLDGYCVLPSLSVCVNLKNLTLRFLCSDVEVLYFEGMTHLRGISTLTLQQTEVSGANGCMTMFMFFPGVTELQLYLCAYSGENFLRSVALHCREIRKLVVRCCFDWHDDCFKYVHHFRKLSYLSLCGSDVFTDEGVFHLQKISELVYLELRECRLVTVECLKVICGFEKLQTVKFDLNYCGPPVDLKATHVKNRNLHLMFYHCKNVTSLENLRKQHLSVTMLGN